MTLEAVRPRPFPPAGHPRPRPRPRPTTGLLERVAADAITDRFRTSRIVPRHAAPDQPDDHRPDDHRPDHALHASASTTAPSRRIATPLRAFAVALIAGLALLSLAGFAFGWRVHSMITPSMGRTAPVGSVVLTAPVSVDEVRVGEIVSFHPPGRPGTTFVHRVVSIGHDGGVTTLRTKGDINGSVDGWVLTGRNLTGHERVIVPDLGFLLQMLPFLLLGALLIALITSGRRRSRRGPLRILLFSALVSFLMWHFQPLSRVDLVTQTITNGKGHATIVPTGALPMRVTATGGTHTDLTPGQLGAVTRDHLPPSGHFGISSAIHLTGWWWLLVLVWLVPLALSLRYTRTSLEASDVDPDAGGAPVDDAQPRIGRHSAERLAAVTHAVPAPA